MKWIKKLLFGTPKVYPSDDRISNLSVDKEGNISATATLSVNGEKLAIPLSANAEELEQILRNKNNPNHVKGSRTIRKLCFLFQGSLKSINMAL